MATGSLTSPRSNPRCARRKRDVAAFLGLVPKRDQSGETDKQLRISKAGTQDISFENGSTQIKIGDGVTATFDTNGNTAPLAPRSTSEPARPSH